MKLRAFLLLFLSIIISFSFIEGKRKRHLGKWEVTIYKDWNGEPEEDKAIMNFEKDGTLYFLLGDNNMKEVYEIYYGESPIHIDFTLHGTKCKGILKFEGKDQMIMSIVGGELLKEKGCPTDFTQGRKMKLKRIE